MSHYETAIAPGSTPEFELAGGDYGIDFVADAWNAGSVTLKKRAGDGKKWLAALTAWSADGSQPTKLPSGTYRLDVASATGVYVQMTRIPEL